MVFKVFNFNRNVKVRQTTRESCIIKVWKINLTASSAITNKIIICSFDLQFIWIWLIGKKFNANDITTKIGIIKTSQKKLFYLPKITWLCIISSYVELFLQSNSEQYIVKQYKSSSELSNSNFTFAKDEEKIWPFATILKALL